MWTAEINGTGFRYYFKEEKMKVIDLLNKIANGEELPPKILFHNMIWILKSDLDYCEDYYSKNLDVYLFYNKWALTNNLNDEIEIIEEGTDKKIEPLVLRNFTSNQKKIARKVNELIEKVNKDGDI